MPFYYPPINDITTTPDNPPDFLSGSKPYPQRFNSIQKKYYSDLAPLLTKAQAKVCLDAIESLVRKTKNWSLVQRDDQGQALEAMVVTPLMRFRDDIIFEVREGSGGQRAIHMRSKSRLGRGDLGANAKRIRATLQDLSKLLGM